MINSIISASDIYRDDKYNYLVAHLEKNPELKIYYHKACVSRYTSLTNLNPYTRSASSHLQPPKKKLRRSHGSFDFMKHCLYCGCECILEKDKKNPSRWIISYLCRSTVSASDKRPYRQYILDICDSRNDSWADDVRGQIESAVSNLHAVEAQYHHDCFVRFVNKKQLPQHAGQINAPQAPDTDDAFNFVTRILKENKTQVWNSIELFVEYESHGGCEPVS